MKLSRVEVLEAVMKNLNKSVQDLADEIGVEFRQLNNFIHRNGIRKGDLKAGKIPKWYEEEKDTGRNIGGLNRVEVVDLLLENPKKSMSKLALGLGETPEAFEYYRRAMGIYRSDLNDGVFPVWYLQAKGYKEDSGWSKEIVAKDDSDKLNWYALYACIRNPNLSVSEAVTYMGLGERITIDASIDKGEDLDVEYKA